MTPEQQQFVQQFDARLKAHMERHVKPTTPEQKQAEREYWQGVWNKERQIFSTRQPAIKQEMSYEAARKAVWILFEERANEISTLEQNPGFNWDFSGGKGELIGNIIRYFINDPACRLGINSEGAAALAKGLFIYGPVGTTKTETMMIMEKFCRKQGLTKAFTLCSMAQIYVNTKSSKEYNPIEINVQGNRAFDEFGLYLGAVTRFGETIDPTEAIFEERYNRWRRYGQTTILISNQPPDIIKPNLSTMLADRFKMFTPVLFGGESKR